MPARTARPCLAAPLALLLSLSFLGPAVAQEATPKEPEGKLLGYVVNGRGEVKPVVRLAKSEIPLYRLVNSFYSKVFQHARMSEDGEPRSVWTDLGVEPFSVEARSIMKAALLAEALYLDIPLLPSGVSDEEFLEAQHRNKVKEVGGIRQITLQMLRELKGAGYPLEVLGKFLDEKVRASMSITVYGDRIGEYERKYLDLQEDFSREIEKELPFTPSPAEEKK